MRLRGKIALVTGFGSGLGRAIAILFAREGASVMGTSTTDAKGKETLEVIKRNGGKARFRVGDVRKTQDRKKVVEEAIANFGGLEIVVNSAGVRTNGSITEISEEDWDRTVDTNLKGVFVVSRLAIPEMVKRGGVVIINISARSGITGAGRASGLLCLQRSAHHPNRGYG